MDLNKLIEQLTRHEGLRLKPYKDSVGKCTIGIGRNLDDVGISEIEAQQLLLNDINNAKFDLDSNLPWWRMLNEVRQNVLLNMCFNLGITRLLKFRNTLHHMRAENYEDAADHMLDSLWAKQVKGRALDLSNQMRKGVE